MTMLPTGFDVPINHTLKGRAAKASSALWNRVILRMPWRATVPHAIHSPRGGQQQRGLMFDLVHQRLRAVATGYGPHAQLASRAGAAVRASAERRRTLPARWSCGAMVYTHLNRNERFNARATDFW